MFGGRLRQNESIAELREKSRNAPEAPGVYLHKGASGKVLYVGKAKNLRSRLKSYFFSLENHTPKTRSLVARISDFEVFLVDSENEALVLENNLIKFHQPPYNILLRDDKSYPFLKLTMEETWPRLILARKKKADGGLYFGPFASGNYYELLNIINRFFKLVKCTPSTFKSVRRPCNYYDIKRCMGPCKLPVDESEYKQIVTNVRRLLQGDSQELLKDLKKQMDCASQDMKYEKAAELRDQLRTLEKLFASQSLQFSSAANLDLIAGSWLPQAAGFCVVRIRDGKLLGGEPYAFKVATDDLNLAQVAEGRLSAREQVYSNFVCQYYQKHQAPQLIVLHDAEKWCSPDELRTICTYIENLGADQLSPCIERNGLQVSPRFKKILSSSEMKDLVRLAQDNAQNKLTEYLHMEEKSVAELGAVQAILKLEEPPYRVECFDISTFQGAETVASQVVFKDGRPHKAEYRRYIIKEVSGQDDFASMREVIRRRFREVQSLDEMPQILLIDGGTPQVREVASVLRAMGITDLCLVGIAKSRTKRSFSSAQVESSHERLVVPESLSAASDEFRFKTIELKIGSSAFRLITRIRDEAHRFAIEFHRKRRNKATFKSVLDAIPGLGEKRRKAIRQAYKSLEELRSANVDDIAQKTKIPIAVAHRVLEALREH